MNTTTYMYVLVMIRGFFLLTFHFTVKPSISSWTVTLDHTPNVQADTIIHTHHVRTRQISLAIHSGCVWWTILTRVGPSSINTITSIAAGWTTQAFVDVLIAVVPSPAGGTDTNGPCALWMVKTVSRVIRRAGVRQTVVHNSAVLTSVTTLTFTFIANTSIGTGAVGTTRGGATVVMWLVASQTRRVSRRTVQSVWLGKGSENTNLVLSAPFKAWIDNVFTAVASAIEGALALIVVSTKGWSTRAIALTLTGLTHIKVFSAINPNFICQKKVVYIEPSNKEAMLTNFLWVQQKYHTIYIYVHAGLPSASSMQDILFR